MYLTIIAIMEFTAHFNQLLEGGMVVVVVVAEEWQQDQHWTVPTAEIVVGNTPFPPDRTLEILMQHFGETFYHMMCAPLISSNCFSISKLRICLSRRQT